MADVTRAREAIVAFARQFVGSHYLWGAGGATPGAYDGAPYRRGGVWWERNSLDLPRPSIWAAATDVAFDGQFVCAGRYKKIHGGRPAYPTDWDLQNYLEELKQDYSLPWKPFCNYFTPRVIQGSNIEPKTEIGRLVWGEDCRGKRHFDCISFVNFVLTYTTRAPTLPGAPPGWSNDIGLWFRNTQPVRLTDSPVPGDILFRGGLVTKTKPPKPIQSDRNALAGLLFRRQPVETLNPNANMSWSHIALLGGGFVVQAEEAITGVHADMAWDPGDWIARGRLATNFLPG